MLNFFPCANACKMSKLKVKSSKSNRKLPLSANIQLSLTKGSKINHERCMQQPEVDNCMCLKERSELPKNFYLCKILYPHESTKKYPKCDHANDITPNRDIWTHKKYMEYLSMPKRVHARASMPKCIRKNISSATVHVQKLAQPKKLTLLETFKTHSKHLSIFKIETLLTKIYDAKFQTPQQAMSEMKQKLREKINKVKRQKSDIRSLQKKIKKCNEFNNLAENLTKTFREFMTRDCRVDACDESEEFSKFVHDRLSHIFKSPRANKNNADVVDKVLFQFSDKIASCMNDVLKNTRQQLKSHGDTNDKCIEHFKKLGLSIDDFYPPDLINQEEEVEEFGGEDGDISTATLEQTQVAFEEENKIDELSFLRPSQIVITSEDCERLQEQLKRMEAALSDGSIKRSASQKTLKSAKDANSIAADSMAADSIAADTIAGTIDGTIKKKKKPKKKKKAKKVNMKCFGNINLKPQWAVEWNSKDSGNVDDEA